MYCTQISELSALPAFGSMMMMMFISKASLPTRLLAAHSKLKALRTLRNGKAPGADQITPEMLKAEPEETSKELKRIFDLIWENETVPAD